jgi:hypothetical protein
MATVTWPTMSKTLTTDGVSLNAHVMLETKQRLGHSRLTLHSSVEMPEGRTDMSHLVNQVLLWYLDLPEAEQRKIVEYGREILIVQLEMVELDEAAGEEPQPPNGKGMTPNQRAAGETAPKARPRVPRRKPG